MPQEGFGFHWNEVGKLSRRDLMELSLSTLRIACRKTMGVGGARAKQEDWPAGRHNSPAGKLSGLASVWAPGVEGLQEV